MLYKNLYNHSLFMLPCGKVYRKHSAAFAVEVTGQSEAIIFPNESVMPVTRAEASQTTGMDYRYL